MTQKYDGDKSFAILTGVVCFLIFMCGTTLGAYDAITRLGAAGILATCCYLILDMAGAWAAYIDYHEDGNAREWAAWTVKGIACLGLLFIGGLCADRMMKESKSEAQGKGVTEAYTRIYNDCIRDNPKTPGTCQRLAEGQLKLASASVEKEKDSLKASNEWAEKLLNYPLFHYLPGILGMLCIIGLGLVNKLSKPTGKYTNLPEASESLSKAYKFTASLPQAYLKASGKSSAETYFSKDGSKAYKLLAQSSGFQVRDQRTNEYLGHLSRKLVESLQGAPLSFEWIDINFARKR